MNEFLKPFPSHNKAASLHVDLAGVTYPDPSYRIFRPDSPVTVIEYVLSGQGLVLHEGKERPVGRGEIYLLSAGEHHTYFAHPKDPYSKIFLNVRGPLCLHLLRAYGLEGERFFHLPGLEDIFRRIPALLQSPLGEDEQQAALQGIFVEILSRLGQNRDQALHSKEALQIKQILDANAHRSVSAEEIGRLLFRCPDYCQKLFKREFGVTPYAYQLSRKMQTACALLRETQLSVEEIALSLGYCDPHYFSNLFQKKMGCRPLRYRKGTK